MASAPNNLPLFYNRLEPLSSTAHGHLKARTAQAAPFLAKAHAIPLTSDEFVICQRFYPIVFSVGESPVPLALMGLNEGGTKTPVVLHPNLHSALRILKFPVRVYWYQVP